MLLEHHASFRLQVVLMDDTHTCQDIMTDMMTDVFFYFQTLRFEILQSIRRQTHFRFGRPDSDFFQQVENTEAQTNERTRGHMGQEARGG